MDYHAIAADRQALRKLTEEISALQILNDLDLGEGVTLAVWRKHIRYDAHMMTVCLIKSGAVYKTGGNGYLTRYSMTRETR